MAGPPGAGLVQGVHRETTGFSVAFRHGSPPLQPTVVRPDLFAKLELGTAGLLTLISGPPGAGKTQLLRSWLQQKPPQGPVGWLSTARSDGRPARFWTELLKLIARTLGEATTALPDPAYGTSQEFLSRLETAVDQFPVPVLIILDDFEQLHSEEVTSGLDVFLRSPQSTLRFAIASRTDPSISLQRLRLAGQLTEIRSSELAMNLEQAHELFEISGIELTGAQLLQLHERTEGWVGGLSLAALSLREHPDPDGFVRDFAGDERAVADYLVEEVLHQQPAPMREFMLRTSVVDELEPALADALTTNDDGGPALEALARVNAFLLPVDKRHRRYRYHPMFLELLRSQLQYQMPEAFALQHSRAARWFATKGQTSKAIRHALRADDLAAASGLVSEHWLSLVLHGDADRLAAWIAELPPRMVGENAELALAGAGAALALGDLESAQGYAALAEERAPAVPAKRRAQYTIGNTALMMAEARMRSDTATIRSAAHKLLAAHHVSDSTAELRAVAHLSLGIAESWETAFMSGFEQLEQALELARRHQCEYIVLDCLSQLALFKALAGELREAARAAHRAVTGAAERGWERDVITAPAHLALALVNHQRAAPREAVSQLRVARLAAGPADSRTTLVLIELLELVLLSEQERAHALRLIHGIQSEIDEWALPRCLTLMAASLEAQLLAEAGETERASAAIERIAEPDETAVALSVVQARLSLAAGDPGRALQHLRAEPGQVPEVQQSAAAIEALGLAAVCKHLLYNDDEALALVERALSEAQPQDYRLPLLKVGAPLRDLLKRRIRAGTAQRSLAGELIQCLDGDGPGQLESGSAGQLLEPLSEREEAVLRYLPTPMSKSEIAAELFISVNTVKTHTKNIYRKLDVGTRSAAVHRAKSMNMV